MNFEYLYYRKKLGFLHNVFWQYFIGYDYETFFGQSDEYTKLYAFNDINIT